MNSDNYIINKTINKNLAVSSTHDDTHICAFGDLIVINRPIYHIPTHILSAIYVCAWRDCASSSLLTLAARRITCSMVLGVLATVGVVDAVIRVAVAILNLVIKRSTVSSEPFLRGAFLGLYQSFYYATLLQIRNFSEKNIMTYIILK